MQGAVASEMATRVEEEGRGDGEGGKEARNLRSMLYILDKKIISGGM